MAARPWVTPEEVRSYSEREKVQARSDDKLKVDISRAEQYVIQYTRNRFDDAGKYPVIPESVKTAVILIAEVYGSAAADGKGEYKSETFDDYSYTTRIVFLTLLSVVFIRIYCTVLRRFQA